MIEKSNNNHNNLKMIKVSNSNLQSERHAPSDFTTIPLSCTDSLKGGMSPFFIKNLLETEKMKDVTAILKHSQVFFLPQFHY